MEEGEEAANWSEAVEDLVAAGDTQGAISFLENLISKLQVRDDSAETTALDLQLASALCDLANLYSSIGFSLKSDELRNRASLIRERSHSSRETKNDSKEDCLLSPGVASAGKNSVRHESRPDGNPEKSTKTIEDDSPCKSSSDDDWEAIADREPNELLSSECLPGVSNLSLEDSKVQAPKRRGRGTFSYNKDELYSDQLSDKSLSNDPEDEDSCLSSDKKIESLQSKYGTRHVLVLADFSPSTRTTDLEKLFEGFRDRGVVIRWVNDTTALAVFRTPTIALEARNSVHCPFTVRILEGDDELLHSIAARDLEPPRARPQTSARTAQRLIAQSMGLKLPSSTFGSRELRNQEEARRNRIVTRQKLRDDAWGAD
ncbi:hypothetical protein SLA2020_222650 [Shorea laevis]